MAAEGSAPEHLHDDLFRDGAHHVVIVGAGFGGLFAARFFRGAPVDVTLIARTNHHLFQPLLYQVATGILSEGQIAPATRDVLKSYKNVRVELGEVTGFDLERKRVTSIQANGREIVHDFDSLIVAAGAGGSYFGHDEFEQWAPGMKTLADALDHRARIFGAFEMAELEEDAEARKAWLTFVVVGGGPTGVEISGQIAELSRRALKHNFRRFDPREVRVLLFEGSKEVLGGFGDKLSGKGRSELERTGVEIHVGSIVTHIDGDGVDVKMPDGSIEHFESKTKIWAAGVSASPLAKMLAEESGAECDRAGRIKVEPDCSLPGHPDVFAVGDMMNFDGLPGVAEVAMQSGIHAARTIRRRLVKGEQPKPWKYRDLGSMAAVSRRRAIVSFKGVRVTGFLGWIMWLVVHLTFMTGFKNRFSTLVSWGLSFVGRGRTERAISREIAGESR
jgi:NADH:ubiquinone reductase (H+-translocating)